MAIDDLDNVKASHAYWLSPKGKIYNVNMKHIDFVRDNLELFKLTLQKYQEYYKKYKEPFGFEGKGREEMFIDIMKRGWIRIRDYQNKGWSVEIWEMDSYTKDLLFKWAGIIKGFIKEHNELKESYFYNHNTVNIHIIKLEQQKKPMYAWFIKTSFDEILQGKLYERKMENLLDFSTFINENESNFEVINEAKLSRIWQHIKDDKSFGVISPYRAYLSQQENKQRYDQLKKEVRKLGYGFIEMIGGFDEEGNIVKEKSLFIPNVKRSDITELGIKYDQYSVIYKDSKEFIEIGTNAVAGVGEVKNKFDKISDKNIDLGSDNLKYFFSHIAKGSHKQKKFLFKMQEMFLYEVIDLSFNEIAYGKKINGKNNTIIKLL